MPTPYAAVLLHAKLTAVSWDLRKKSFKISAVKKRKPVEWVVTSSFRQDIYGDERAGVKVVPLATKGDSSLNDCHKGSMKQLADV